MTAPQPIMDDPIFAPERNEVDEQLEEASSDQVAHVRNLCKTDLFFLSQGILGYNDQNYKFGVEEFAHKALCRFMVQEKSNRRMVLMPRGHLKTTICTIADSIRLTLENPNIRILIQNEVLENAESFLKEIKNHWMTNKLLRFLFPELVPEKFYGPGVDWAQNHASVVRTTNAKESTYWASGSGGSPQSKHFERIKNDDLVGEKQKNSQVEMAKTIGWIDAQTPLLDSLEDTLDYYGTRKTMSDGYAHVMEKYKSRLKVFVREPIEEGRPIYSKFPMSELEAIMRDTPDVWAYDYMNNPIGKGGLDWGKGMLRNFMLHEGRVYFEHHLTGKPTSWSLRELYIITVVDPNSGKVSAPDKAAINTQGWSPDGGIFSLSSRSGRWDPDQLVNEVYEDCKRWNPQKVGFEDVGQQNTMFYFEKKCEAESRYWTPVALPRDNTKTKEARIRAALTTPMKARRVYVMADQLALIGQIQLFPSLADHNWDEIDCFSFGPELAVNGVSLKFQQEEEEAEQLFLSRGRGITGYGRSV